jgi:hypothetical protein
MLTAHKRNGRELMGKSIPLHVRSENVTGVTRSGQAMGMSQLRAEHVVHEHRHLEWPPASPV